jgi:hypothetical protein
MIAPKGRAADWTPAARDLRPERRGKEAGPAARRRETSTAVAASLLGGACVAWAAIPLSGALAEVVLIVAAAGAALGAARLWLGPPAETAGFASGLGRFLQRQAALVRTAPWAEVTVIAVLVLEALHRSRPSHTALLGVALLTYLFAVHLSESRARLAVLLPQAPLLAAGLGLLVLATCATLLPAATGSAASLMAVLAALAAIAVGGLALTR